MSYMCASECVTTSRQAELVSVGRLLSPVCLRWASVLIARMTTQSLCSLRLISAARVRLPLTAARGTAGEEVSGHFTLPLHLDNTSAVQLVAVVGQHVVQVRGHLRKDTDIWHPHCQTLNPSQDRSPCYSVKNLRPRRNTKNRISELQKTVAFI